MDKKHEKMLNKLEKIKQNTGLKTNAAALYEQGKSHITNDLGISTLGGMVTGRTLGALSDHLANTDLGSMSGIVGVGAGLAVTPIITKLKNDALKKKLFRLQEEKALPDANKYPQEFQPKSVVGPTAGWTAAGAGVGGLGSALLGLDPLIGAGIGAASWGGHELVSKLAKNHALAKARTMLEAEKMRKAEAKVVNYSETPYPQANLLKKTVSGAGGGAVLGAIGGGLGLNRALLDSTVGWRAGLDVLGQGASLNQAYQASKVARWVSQNIPISTGLESQGHDFLSGLSSTGLDAILPGAVAGATIGGGLNLTANAIKNARNKYKYLMANQK